jgi:hypothetical protein
MASFAACTTLKPKAPSASQELLDTPMPTVPPSTPTPPATATPLSTRPIGKDFKPAKGQLIGPIITHLGAARADGVAVQPVSVDSKGIPTYVTTAGSGFILVVEAKAGIGGNEVARTVFAYQADDPSVRPDLEIISSRDLGDGSKKVCDRMKPDLGGVPAVNPPRFDTKKEISDAINDFACRFETFNESASSCTATAQGDFAFIERDTQQQFCMMVARAWGFPEGDTIITVRVRDMKGNPGPSKQVRIRHPAASKVPKQATPVPTPAKPKSIPTRGA